MKFFLAGGHGQVGRPLAERLRADGHLVVVGSRRDGVDVLTGDGLGAALQGVDVVVDVLNTTELDAGAAAAFFRGTTQRLLAAELSTGVRHHVLLSIVGTDRAPGNGYYVGKVAGEDALRAGDVPFSIVRATQFHEFLPVIADWLTVRGEVLAPPILLQPVALREVVDLLARTALAEPTGVTVDLAGPQAIPLDELLRRALAGDPRPVRTVEGSALGVEAVDSLVPLGEHLAGTVPFPG